MAVAKVTLNGVTLMDVTDATASGSEILTNYNAYVHDGTKVSGSYVPPTPQMQTKTATYTPSESQQTATITADSGYDGLDEVDITVGAISSSYVGSNIPRNDDSDIVITPHSPDSTWVEVPYGFFDDDWEIEVPEIALPSSTSASPTSGFVSKATITPSESTQYLNLPTGYNTTGDYYTVGAISSTYVGSGITRRTASDVYQEDEYAVIPPGLYTADPTWFQTQLGTAGTPTATKGTVSNHSVSVTPSVTNTAGYISGGTETGTAVTVSASELVSGSETKTANGTYDVTNLAELVVNVSSGTSVKTASGTFSGDGSRDITFTCNFEPDVIYWTSDPGTSSSTGVVAGIIVRGMMAASRYRNNSTSNSHYAMIDITGMNTAGSSYSFRATYSNSTVTLYSFSSNARTYFVNGRTYSWQAVKYTT